MLSGILHPGMASVEEEQVPVGGCAVPMARAGSRRPVRQRGRREE